MEKRWVIAIVIAIVVLLLLVVPFRFGSILGIDLAPGSLDGKRSASLESQTCFSLLERYDGRSVGEIERTCGELTVDEARAYAQDRGAAPLGNECSIVPRADINQDGFVNTGDIVALLAGWRCSDCPGDINEDGEANVGDIIVLLSQWTGSEPFDVCQCADLIDNDQNGLIDYPEDPGCTSLDDPDESGGGTGETECSDGVDNDGDGLIDLNDNGCEDEEDNSEFIEPQEGEFVVFFDEFTTGSSSVSISDEFAINTDHRFSGGKGIGYVHKKNGIQWDEVQQLMGSQTESNDFFGFASDIDGNTMVISAYLDEGASSNAGAVYVFEYDGSSWVEVQILTASDGATNDLFGIDVAIDGDFIVVGANGRDGVGSNSGSVYVFEYDGSSWVEEQLLTASDESTGDQFGRRVDVEENLIVVGSQLDDDNGTDSGSAYVFKFETSSNNWEEFQKLVGSNVNAADNFGSDVAVSGDFIGIGVESSDYITRGGGLAFSFKYNQALDSWEEHQVVSFDGIGENDNFGNSIELDGDVLVVGAISRSGPPLFDNQGAVYVYSLENGLWILEKEITNPTNTESHQMFGKRTDLHGKNIIIGNEETRKRSYIFGECEGVLCAFCGDGVKQDGEFCDDGVDNGKINSCNTQCTGLTEINRVFLTSQTWNGAEIAGWIGAERKCQTAAESAELDGYWTAWISGSAVTAPRNRFRYNDNTSYFLLDNTQIALSWDDLADGEIRAPINLDEFSQYNSENNYVWTATDKDGGPHTTGCGDGYWNSTEGNAHTGRNLRTDEGWTEFSPRNCTLSNHLYCFEKLINLLECGNGVVEIENNEQCDDDNVIDGDGCNSACEIEFDWQCEGNPSLCTFHPVCGNGICQPGENNQNCNSDCLPPARIFITNDDWNGDLGGFTGADQKCDTAASAAGLNGDWKAWLSSPSQDVGERLVNYAGPYENMQGQLVAENWNDLVTCDEPNNECIKAHLYYDAQGNFESGSTWTGTLEDGSAGPGDNCQGWSYRFGESAITGTPSPLDARWTHSGTGNCLSFRKIYCVEQL